MIFPGRSANQAIPHLQAVRSNIANTGFYLRSPDRPERKPEGPIEPPEDPQVIAVTISIGVAEPEAPGATPDDVLKAADQALYRAKHGGRNRVSR
ncbi:MAG: response regulator PleD [candidate division BRC1 bacterium ADurb.BinA364]|nr:MAG: response regulator PleD [candidate division BRC1 bacterium ADurb.BinA364]